MTKPVGFQDITSNVLSYTINTSTPQCRWVEEQIAELPKPTQDEIYGRFHAVCNRGEKDAAKGRKYLYTSLDYAGLSQQVGKVASDINTCIGLLQLSAQNASWTSSYSALSDFAKKEIEAHGSQRQAAIAAYVDKLDPLPPATPESEDTLYREFAKIMIAEGAKKVKQDIDLAIKHASLFEMLHASTYPIEVVPPIRDRDAEIRALYRQFSLPARLMIEKLSAPATSVDEAKSECLLNAIYTLFEYYIGRKISYENFSGTWRLSEEDTAHTKLYHKISQDCRTFLPAFSIGKPDVPQEEFDAQIKAHLSSLTEADLAGYTPLAKAITTYKQLPKEAIIEHIALAQYFTQAAEVVLLTENSAVLELSRKVQDSDKYISKCFQAYENLPDNVRNDLQTCLQQKHKGCLFQNAEKYQMDDACQAYLQYLILNRAVRMYEEGKMTTTSKEYTQ